MLPELPRQSVCVVFVNYRSERLLVPRAVAMQEAGFAVVIADNSGTVPDISGIEVVVQDGNYGFAAGCNAAVAAAPLGTKVICFHNPDAVVSPTGLDRLAAMAHRNSGATAPAERTPVGVREGGYRYPQPMREVGLAIRALTRPHTSPLSPPAVVDRTRSRRGRRFPGGALMVVDCSAHAAIGGFDEDYFLYGEDLDYWHRLGLAGAPRSLVTDVVVDHASSTGSPLASVRREVLRWLGVELFAQKNLAGWRSFRLAHRLVAPLARSGAQDLVQAVEEQWRRGSEPASVLAELRPRLAAGDLLG